MTTTQLNPRKSTLDTKMHSSWEGSVSCNYKRNRFQKATKWLSVWFPKSLLDETSWHRLDQLPALTISDDAERLDESKEAKVNQRWFIRTLEEVKDSITSHIKMIGKQISTKGILWGNDVNIPPLHWWEQGAQSVCSFVRFLVRYAKNEKENAHCNHQAFGLHGFHRNSPWNTRQVFVSVVVVAVVGLVFGRLHA